MGRCLSDKIIQPRETQKYVQVVNLEALKVLKFLLRLRIPIPVQGIADTSFQDQLDHVAAEITRTIVPTVGK